MPTAAAPITAVASHPRTASRFVSANSPITALREAMSMIIAMIGTAATPLMMALQISALTGSRGVALPARCCLAITLTTTGSFTPVGSARACPKNC
jgi:hypothetical protein